MGIFSDIKGVTGDFSFQADISPVQITADQNDYAPTGHLTAVNLRLSSDATRRVRGLAGGSDGRVVFITNIGSFPIIFTDQDAGSVAANRFLLGGSDLLIAPDETVALIYDALTARWRSLSNFGNPGKIRKNALESRTNTVVLAADTQLITGNLAVNTNYLFKVFLPITGTAAAGGIQVSWTLPAGAGIAGSWVSSAVANSVVIQNSSAVVTVITAANMKVLQTTVFEGIIQIAGTAGSATMNWAQITANAAAVNILAGAFFAVSRL